MFAAYNAAIWPAQVVAEGLGFLLVMLLRRPGEWTSQTIALVLCGFWLLMGVGYHGLFFTQINPLAYMFALLFVAQAGLFAARAFDGRLRFEPTRGWTG